MLKFQTFFEKLIFNPVIGKHIFKNYKMSFLHKINHFNNYYCQLTEKESKINTENKGKEGPPDFRPRNPRMDDSVPLTGSTVSCPRRLLVLSYQSKAPD